MPGTTDTVKAILTPGEFVIRKEAVDMIGAPMLNMINNMPEKGGHSNIDSLIEKATMANMKGMYGGGMVQAGPKPMGTGGMVDAYAGGGMVMDQYGHGGKVKKNLKPVPQGNPGLGKLPEAVRNKMGYMQEGGKVLPAFINGIDSRDIRSVLTQFSEFPETAVQGIYEMNEPSGRGKRYYFGKGQVPSARVSDLEKAFEMSLMDAARSQKEFPQDSIPLSSVLQMLRDPEVKGDKRSIDGMKEGGEVQDSLMGMMGGGMAGYQGGGKVMDYITDLLTVGTVPGIGGVMARRALAKRNSGDIKSDMPLADEQIDAPMIDMDAVLAKKKMQDDAAFSIIPTVGEFKGQRIYQGSPEMSSYLDSDAHSQYIKSKFNFQQGGLINYQDGGMIGPPLPPEMMGQAMNQQLSNSIDMRMQNPQGGELGVVRQESDAIEAAMKDNLARNARLALQKMRLDSILSEQGASMQPEALEPRMFIPQELLQGGQSLDIRDYDKSVEKYLESEYGPQNTLKGILRTMPYLPK